MKGFILHKDKTIGKSLLRKILRDSELTVEEFIELLSSVLFNITLYSQTSVTIAFNHYSL